MKTIPTHTRFPAKFILLSLTLFLLAHLQNFAQNTREIGVNISDLGNFSSQIAYVDAMKQSSSWMAQHPDFSTFDVTDVGGVPVVIPLRADGYPTHAPFVINGDSLIVHCMTLSQQPAPWRYPSGNYTLIFEGSGTVRVHWDVVGGGLDFSTPNTPHTVPVDPSQWGLDIAILASDSADPIRNIRLIQPGFENTYTTQPFRQNFLDLLAPFSVLRFMKPQAMEENALAQWEDRTLPTDRHYWSEGEGVVREGMPYEHLIDLCNQTQKDPWINIPYAADDAFLDSLATMLRDDLNPARTIYIEYGNETWNGSYPFQHTYVNDQGIQMGLHSIPFVAGQRFHTLRSLEVFHRFETIFAGQTHRLYTLIATQPEFGVGQIIVDALGDATINPSGAEPDALCIAPYFGTEVIMNLAATGDTCNVDADDLLDSLSAGLPRWMNEMVPAFRYWADSMGIELITYEGGQYLSNQYGLAPADSCSAANLIAANRDDRMESVYCEYYDQWYDSLGGDLHMTFTLCESYNAYGATGLVESVFQEPDSAPKWRAHENCFGGPATARVTNALEEAMTDAWRIYPNPARGRFRIAGLKSDEAAEVELYGVDGQMKGRWEGEGAGFSGAGVALPDMAQGLYLVRIVQGESARTLRLLKE
ncbi:MAG: T9SS type A sorting domain-containing protein [Bacteroidota bacterium]